MASQPPAAGEPGPVVITGLGVTSAYGRGPQALLDGVLAGRPAFIPVTRFGTEHCRVKVAAQLPGTPVLADEITAALEAACTQGQLSAPLRPAAAAGGAALRPGRGRDALAGTTTGDTAAVVARRCGFPAVPRVYTSACVAGSTAVADAAAMIASGRRDRVVVAAGYLVEPTASRCSTPAGRWPPTARCGRSAPGAGACCSATASPPWCWNRRAAASGRGAAGRWLAGRLGPGRRRLPRVPAAARTDPGWPGRSPRRCAGPGSTPADIGLRERQRHRHPVQRRGRGRRPAPGAWARRAARSRSARPSRCTGTRWRRRRCSSWWSRCSPCAHGRLPVNAGYLGPDQDCQLDLVLDAAREAAPRYALSAQRGLRRGQHRAAGRCRVSALPAAAPWAGQRTDSTPMILASASWPQAAGDQLPPIAGFVTSSFSPLVAELAERCLRGYFGRAARRTGPGRADRGTAGQHQRRHRHRRPPSPRRSMPDAGCRRCCSTSPTRTPSSATSRPGGG